MASFKITFNIFQFLLLWLSNGCFGNLGNTVWYILNPDLKTAKLNPSKQDPAQDKYLSSYIWNFFIFSRMLRHCLWVSLTHSRNCVRPNVTGSNKNKNKIHYLAELVRKNNTSWTKTPCKTVRINKIVNIQLADQ